MDYFWLYLFYSLVAIIVICMILKIRYWYVYASQGKRVSKLIKSFFKLYGKNRIYSASEKKRKFLKASNTINLIIWIAIIFALLAYKFSISEIV